MATGTEVILVTPLEPGLLVKTGVNVEKRRPPLGTRRRVFQWVHRTGKSPGAC